MREIKFRAWDKKNKTMDFPEQFRHAIFCAFGMNGHLEIGNGGDILFLQFTGLKDKEGKDIYEGDILKNNTTDVVEKCFVIFDGGSFSGKGIPEGHCGNGYFKEYKIIGNIYENPELIQALD